MMKNSWTEKRVNVSALLLLSEKRELMKLYHESRPGKTTTFSDILEAGKEHKNGHWPTEGMHDCSRGHAWERNTQGEVHDRALSTLQG